MDSIITSLHASYNADTNTFNDLPDITQEDVEMNLELDERSMQKFQITLLHHELAELMFRSCCSNGEKMQNILIFAISRHQIL